MVIEGTESQDTLLEQKSNTRKWVVAVVLGLLVIVALVASYPIISRWLQADLSVSSDRVRIGVVSRQDLVQDISVQSTVVAGESPTLFSEYSGNITLLVNVGDPVQPGQVIAELTNPQILNQLEQERSNHTRMSVEVEREEILNKQQALTNQRTLDSATVELTAAKREARRAQIAHTSDAISDIDLEKANDDLTSAQFAFNHAEAFHSLDQERMDFELRTKRLLLEQQLLKVQNLERQAEELRIKAPVAGIVGNIEVDQKTNIAVGQEIMTIVDVSLFELDAQIPQTYADDLEIGMRAEVSIDSTDHAAQVTSISPEIIENQVLVRLKFRDETPSGLRRNQRVSVRILIREIPNVLVAPRGQFLNSGGGRIAYRVDDQNIARKTTIQTGVHGTHSVEIMDGLMDGDRIILSNTDAFQTYENVLITQ